MKTEPLQVKSASESQLLSDARILLRELQDNLESWHGSWRQKYLCACAIADLNELWIRGQQLSLLHD
jgi:hypothetical protein